MTSAAPGPLLGLIAFHLLAALVAPVIVGRWGIRRGMQALAVVPLATTIWALTRLPSTVDGTIYEESLRWAPQLGFELSLRVDAFALLMVLLVAGIGVLVFVYAGSYLHDQSSSGRLAGLLVAFAGAMVGLVTSDNILGLFLFWEATSVTSYLLIGIDDESERARNAALRALLTTGAAGLAMLAGFVLLAQETGSWTMSTILSADLSGTHVEVAVVLVLVGALAKSAQFPFHFWLPGAMAAPTPVSAYLHSATMVKAGVYLIARFAPAVADLGLWRPMVVTAGLITLVLGAWRALDQTDLKLLLAHGTTSQLGLMVVLFGLGDPEATMAGVVVLVAHAAYKAAAFMVVGIVDHEAGTRDLRRLDGLHRHLRSTFIVATVAAASMAGLPPMLGFIAKEMSLEALLHADIGSIGIVTAVVVVGSAITVAYSARLLWGGFAGKRVEELLDPVPPPSHGPGPGLLGPAAVLAVATVVFGVVPATVSDLLISAAHALDAEVHTSAISLWHGFNPALGLSALAIGAGVAMFAMRSTVARVAHAIPSPPAANRLFDLILYRTVRIADEVTGRLQTGSLPFYLTVIISTVLLLPGLLLLTTLQVPGDLLLYDRPLQLPIVIIMVIAAAGSIATSHRLAAVICVGAVGYGVAVLFVIQGAPDLAITQLLIETLLLVVFVLVLRHLPRHFTGARTAIPRIPAAIASVLVGLFAAIFTLISVDARPADLPSVSDQIVDMAIPQGDGENVVNVILVDFRAMDTLGEIMVLTVAALGVIGLVRSAQRERSQTRTRLPGRPFRRSPILDTVVRALFRTVLLYSVVLLLIGHDEPGGGFIGGLVAGAAFMLLYLSGGAPSLRRNEPIAPEVFLGGGLAIATLAGMIGWFSGGEFLESVSGYLSIPLVGDVKVSTVLLFDLGVYLVVVGLVISLLRSLGREEVRAL